MAQHISEFLEQSTFNEHALMLLSLQRQEDFTDQQTGQAYEGSTLFKLTKIREQNQDLGLNAFLDAHYQLYQALEQQPGQTKQQHIQAIQAALAAIELEARQPGMLSMRAAEQRAKMVKAVEPAIKEIQSILILYKHAETLERRRELRLIAGLPAEQYHNADGTLTTDYETRLTPELLIAASKHPVSYIQRQLHAMRLHVQAAHDATKDEPAKQALKALYESLTPGNTDWPKDLNQHLAALRPFATDSNPALKTIYNETDATLNYRDDLNKLGFLCTLTGQAPGNIFNDYGYLDTPKIQQQIQAQVATVNQLFQTGKVTATDIARAKLQAQTADLHYLQTQLSTNYPALSELIQLLTNDARKIGTDKQTTDKFQRLLQALEKIASDPTTNPNDKPLLTVQIHALRQTYQTLTNAPAFETASLAANLIGDPNPSNILSSDGNLYIQAKYPTQNLLPNLNRRLADGSLPLSVASWMILSHQSTKIEAVLKEIREYPTAKPRPQNLAAIETSLNSLQQLCQDLPVTQSEYKARAKDISNKLRDTQNQINHLRQSHPEEAKDLASALATIEQQLLPQLQLGAQFATQADIYHQLFAYTQSQGLPVPQLIDTDFNFHPLSEQQAKQLIQTINRSLQTGEISAAWSVRAELANNIFPRLHQQSQRADLNEGIKSAIYQLTAVCANPLVTAEELQQSLENLEQQIDESKPPLAPSDDLLKLQRDLAQHHQTLVDDKPIDQRSDLVSYIIAYARQTNQKLMALTSEEPFASKTTIIHAINAIFTSLTTSPVYLQTVTDNIQKLESEINKLRPRLPQSHPIFAHIKHLKETVLPTLQNNQHYQAQLTSAWLKGETVDLIQENGTLKPENVKPVNKQDALRAESQAVATGDKTTTRAYYQQRLQLHHAQLVALIGQRIPQNQGREYLIDQLRKIQTDIQADDFSSTDTRFTLLHRMADSLTDLNAKNEIKANLTNYQQAIINYRNHRQITQANVWQQFLKPDHYETQYEAKNFNPTTYSFHDHPSAQTHEIGWALPQQLADYDWLSTRVNNELRAHPERMPELGQRLVRAELDTLDEALAQLKLAKQTDGVTKLSKAVTALRATVKDYPTNASKLKQQLTEVKQRQQDTDQDETYNDTLAQALAGIENGQKMYERGDKFLKAQELRASGSRVTPYDEDLLVVSRQQNGTPELAVDTTRHLAETAQAMNDEIHREITSLLEYTDRQLKRQGDKLFELKDSIKPKAGDQTSEATATAFKQAIDDFITDVIDNKTDDYETRVAELKQLAAKAEKDQVDYNKKEFNRLMGGIQSALIMHHNHQQIQASLTFLERGGKTIKLIDEKTGEIKPMFRDPQQLKQAVESVQQAYAHRFKVEKKEGKGSQAGHYIAYDSSEASMRTLVDMLAQDKDFEDTDDFIITTGIFSDKQAIAAASEALALEHTTGRVMHLEFSRFWYSGRNSSVQNDLNQIFATRKELMLRDDYDKETAYATLYTELLALPPRRNVVTTYLLAGLNLLTNAPPYPLSMLSEGTNNSAATFLQTLSITDRKRILDHVSGDALTSFVATFDNRELAKLISRTANPGDAYNKIMEGCYSERAPGILRHLHNDKTLDIKLFREIVYADATDEHVGTLMELSHSKNPFKAAQTTKAAACLFPPVIDGKYADWFDTLSAKSQKSLLQDSRFPAHGVKFLFLNQDMSDASRRQVFRSLSEQQRMTLLLSNSIPDPQLLEMLGNAEAERLRLVEYAQQNPNLDRSKQTARLTELADRQYYWPAKILQYRPDFIQKLDLDTIKAMPVTVLAKIPAATIVTLSDDAIEAIGEKLATVTPKPAPKNGHSWMRNGGQPPAKTGVEPNPVLAKPLKELLEQLVADGKEGLAMDIALKLPENSPQRQAATEIISPPIDNSLSVQLD